MTDITSIITTLLTIVGALVVLVNIITEVLKKVTWDRIPTQFLALLVAQVLTLVAFFGYCQIMHVAVAWYMIIAAVVVGFMVAYAAMFGFEKLREIIGQAIGKKKQ